MACVQGEVIGHLALSVYVSPRTRHSGHFRIAVRDDWQGKGIGTALLRAGVDLADKWLNLTRLELEVFADNEHAVRLYERHGFELEGTLRQHSFRGGRYVDSYVMARLRPAGQTT